MDLRRSAKAITMALALVVSAVAPLSAQTAESEEYLDLADPEAFIGAFFDELDECEEVYSSLDHSPFALCLTGTLARHADALLPYAEAVIEAMADPAERPDAHPILPEVTLATAAAILSDPSLCDLPTPELQASCHAAIAQIDDDPRPCEAVPDPEIAIACILYYIETDPDDVGDCSRFDAIGVDAEDLGRVTGADFCLGAAARLNETPGLCREIENPEVRSLCILGSMMPPPEGWTDIGICDEIVGVNLHDPDEQIGVTSPEGLRELCGTVVAVSAVDSPQALGMCDGIETPVLRDVCLAGAATKQRDGSYCDHITSEPLRKLCRDYLAGAEDEGTEAAADAFTKEFLATLDVYDTPDRVAEGHLGDAGICTALLLEPADCTLRENRITFRLRGDGDVEGTGTIVAEVPMERVGGTSWDVGAEPCPNASAHGEITLTGGFAGLFSRETMRGRAQVKWRHDPTTSEGEGARCGPRGLLSHSGYWEATLRDGLIDGALRFQSGLTVIPFVAKLEAG